MVRRRSKFDPFADNSKPRWLAVCDMNRSVVESVELPPGTDLRAAMQRAADRWASEGWQIEGGFEHGFFFCNRDGARRIVSLLPSDPHEHDSDSYSLARFQRCATCDD